MTLWQLVSGFLSVPALGGIIKLIRDYTGEAAKARAAHLDDWRKRTAAAEARCERLETKCEALQAAREAERKACDEETDALKADRSDLALELQRAEIRDSLLLSERDAERKKNELLEGENKRMKRELEIARKIVGDNMR